MNWYNWERDSMIAHGVSRFLKERLYDQSDKFHIVVCKKCKNFATTQSSCKSCKTDMVAKVNLPYSASLLISELKAMGIKLEINTVD